LALQELAFPGVNFEGTIKIKTNEVYEIDRAFDNSTANSHLVFDEQQVGKSLAALLLSLK